MVVKNAFGGSVCKSCGYADESVLFGSPQGKLWRHNRPVLKFRQSGGLRISVILAGRARSGHCRSALPRCQCRCQPRCFVQGCRLAQMPRKWRMRQEGRRLEVIGYDSDDGSGSSPSTPKDQLRRRLNALTLHDPYTPSFTETERLRRRSPVEWRPSDKLQVWLWTTAPQTQASLMVSVSQSPRSYCDFDWMRGCLARFLLCGVGPVCS